jgi:hypothetical protein
MSLYLPVALSAPPLAPPIPPQQWQGLEVTWEGPDGSFWDLTDPAGGVLLVREGVEGLHFPQITRQGTRSRAFPGRRLRGWQAREREVFWRVYVWADGTEAWLDRVEAFFSTIHPTDEGTWTVKAGNRRPRSLQLTGVFDDSFVYDRDPTKYGWHIYPVTLEASMPYWQGERVRRGPWSNPNPVPFFPEGGAPPFHISKSSSFGDASVSNEGDVDAFGVWWVQGPLSSIELGIGDTLIRVPFTVADGEMLRIDCDPRRPTGQRGPVPLNPETGDVDTDLFVGTDATRDLGLQDFAAIPRGRTVPLHIAGVGSGSVMFDLDLQHFRAF